MARESGSQTGSQGSQRKHRRSFLAHGDVPLVLLGLLEDRSMHGYEMIKSLEARSGGLYKPSAGAIYPTLSMLEDQELIESAPDGRKRVFSITVEGREYLEKHGGANGLWRSILTNAIDRAEKPVEHRDPSELRIRIRDLFGQFFESAAIAGDDSLRLAELEHIIDDAERELDEFMASMASKDDDED